MQAELQLLRNFELTSNGARVGGISTPRIQSLIAYLAFHSDTPLLRSQLAYMFWPDSTEAQAHTNLRKAIHEMRQLLSGGDGFLHVDSTTIQVDCRDLRIDVHEFLKHLDAAAQARRLGQPDAEQAALEQAVDLYRGDLLPGCYDDWAVSERERLRGLFVQAAGRLAALLENRHFYRDAVRVAELLLDCDRWHEETYRQLMRLYALVGDRAAALHAYHNCATILQRELNAEPSPETQQAYARLMQSEVGSQPGGTAPFNPAARFVARVAEWKELQSAWRTTLEGAARLVLISGEAGIGKTRLANEMLTWAARQGLATVSAVCYAAEGRLAYAPVASWLRSRPLHSLESHWLSEIARLLPGIVPEVPAGNGSSPANEPWQRQHLFEALAHGLLNSGEPLICLLDNIHWCDPDTLQWLHFLFRFRPAAPLLVIATARPEELEPESPAAELITALAADDQLVRLDLPRLAEKETLELASQVADHELSAAECERIYRDTEGVPLFVVEMVRAGLGGREPASALGRNTVPLPRKVQAVIAQRLGRLSSSPREVLEAAAVLGRAFSIDLLRPACQLDEAALVHALDDLWKRRLIRDQGGSYDFSHDKIREAVYEGIGDARRKWLHRAAAETLARQPAPQPDTLSVQIAAHYEQAGAGEQAVQYYLLAARQAQRLFATDAALGHIQKALLLNRDSRNSAELYEAQGDLLTFQQKHRDAGSAYREALIACAQEDWLRRARLHRKYAAVFARVDNMLAEQALVLAENSLGNVRDQTPDYWHEWIDLQLSRLEASYWRWDHHEMSRLLDGLAPVIEIHGSIWQRTKYMDSLIRRNSARGRFLPDEESIRLARECLQLLESTGDLNASGQGQSTLGFVLFLAGQLDEAEIHLREAVLRTSRTGDHTVLLISLNYLSLAHRCQGRCDQVRLDDEALETALAKSSIGAYEGILRANRAWLSYRDGRLAEAHQLAREAVDLWASESPRAYPVQWPALSILLALAVERGDTAEILHCLQRLMDNSLSVVQPPVLARLETAANDGGHETGELVAHAREVVGAMRDVGYL